MSGKEGWRAAISFLVVLTQATCVLPAISDGGSINQFSDGGEEISALLASAGNVTFANLSVPAGALLMNGSVGISPLSVQGAYPLSPAIDIGADGSPDWAFEGTGYGPFGMQTLLADGSPQKEFGFTDPGAVRFNITLPAAASVGSARLGLCGTADGSWWNASWRHRMPLNVTEKSGADQTDFVVELLLDTRTWTLGDADMEFRVTRQNATTLVETEVPIEVRDELANGSKCFEASLLFAVQDLRANATARFFLYYDNPGATQRSPLYADFNANIIRDRLLDQPAATSIMGPLLGPQGASFDRYGNYWVADTARDCVFGYTRILGVADEPGSDGTHLSTPRDVVVTPSGRVAVCDSGNFRVQVFEPDGTLAFTIGQTGVPGSDNGHFSLPSGLGTDADGWLYVTDSGSTAQRVQVFDANGTYIATLGGAAGQGDYQFNQPVGIFVSPSKDILVADSSNRRVQAFRYVPQLNWTFNFTLGTTGQAGTDNTHLDGPLDVTMDSAGRIFIADYGNSRVQVFSGTSFVRTIGVLKTPRPDNSHLNMPTGVAVSPDGSLFVSDFVPSTFLTSRVVVFDSQYQWVRNIGDRHWTGLADPGASDTELWLPYGITAGSNGTMFVSDTYNHRVQIFGPLGQSLGTVGVTGVPGNDSSHFYYPRGLDIGPDGRLLVADGGNSTMTVCTSNHRVMVFNDLVDGTADIILGVTGQFGNDATHLNGPWDVSVDQSGRIGVADTGYFMFAIPTPLVYGQRIQIYDNLLDSVADGTFGVAGVAGNDSTHLRWPAGICLSDSGGTYVADTQNSRVVVFKDDVDQTADIVINPSGTPGSGEGQLRLPLDVDVDASGRTYIADSGNHRIEIFGILGLHERTIGETGVNLSDEFHLNAPGGVHMGEDGKIYIADTQNNRVMRITQAGLSVGRMENSSGPQKVALDVGADGSVDWSWQGTLEGNHTASGLAVPINDLLANLTGTPDGFGIPMVTFPVELQNGGRGRLTVSGILLEYDCLLTVKGLSDVIRGYIANQSISNSSTDVLVPLSYSAACAGGLRLAGLNITGDFPPRLVSPVPDLSLDEDTANDSLCDLGPYFQDDIDTALNHSLINVSNSTIANARLVNGSRLSVDCTVLAARDWNGIISVVARATDSSGLSAISNRFNVTVRPVNDPPRITSAPPTAAYAGEQWRYDIAAVDPENGTLGYALDRGPAGMALNASSGLLLWTPAQAQLGPQDVSVRVSDGELGALQNFTINVFGAPMGNHPPRITSEPVAYALEGAEYVYTIVAVDDDFDNLTFSLLGSPWNMTIGELTGVIRWTPGAAQKGAHAVIARVSDSKSNSTQAFNITVVENLSDLAPVIIITEPLPNAKVSGKAWLKGTAASVSGANITAVAVSTDGGAGWQAASGRTVWMFGLDTSKLHDGALKILVRATDSANRSSEANITLDVQNAPAGPARFLGLDPIVWVMMMIVICVGAIAGAYALIRRKRRAPPVGIGPLNAPRGGVLQGAASSVGPPPPSSPPFSPGPPSSRSASSRSPPASSQAPPSSAPSSFAPPSQASSSSAASSYPPPSQGPSSSAYPSSPLPSQGPSSSAYPSSPPPSQGPPPYPPTAHVTQSYQTVQSQASPAFAGAAAAAAAGPRAPAKAAPPQQKPVDSAFLIYHDGRLITYFSRSDSIKLDDTLDMIRRFVKASFSGELGRLDAMAYENSNIIMERGNLMYMVVITPLTKYEPLRHQMRALLDDIDRRYRVVFKIWDGDFGKVKGIRSMIESFAGEGAVPPSPEEPAPAQAGPSKAPSPQHPASFPSHSSSFPYLSSKPSSPLPSSPLPPPPPPSSPPSSSSQPSSLAPSSTQPLSIQSPATWDDSPPPIPTPTPMPPPQPKVSKQSDER